MEDAFDRAPSGDGDESGGVVTRRRLHPMWVRFVLVGVLLALCFLVARTCQQAQIRVTQDQAVATAKQEVDFTPELTQVRLLRQGIGREPFWIVSLSIPIPEHEGAFRRLAVVRVDANTGKVVEVQQDSVGQRGGP